MSKRTIIQHDRAIILYNAEKKEVMGIFAGPSLAARFLFTATKRLNSSQSQITNAAERRGCILKSKVPFKVAVRFAGAGQEALLEGMDYKILNGYPEPSVTSMKGFDSTRAAYSVEHAERRSKEWMEKQQQKVA